MDLYTVRKKLNMGIPLTSMNIKVTDYARVSTDSISQKKSLKNQVEHFKQYIKENKNWTYVEGYVDEGITGTSDVKRDNFMKMIEDARCGKFDLIVTKEISRFSRNTLDSIKYTRELLSYGVAVLFINDNINTAMPDSELRLTIMASMAQDEIRRLSERVKFGMNRAIERGEILGNNMLYGYIKDKDTKVLNIIDEEAEIVRKIFLLYAIEELSLSKIVKILNNEKIYTRENKKWSVTTISRMIENPKYKGYYCARKKEIIDYMTKKVKYHPKNDWIMYEDKIKIPPIVDEYLWELANNRLIARKKSFKKRESNKIIYKNRYLYSAKIYCIDHNTIFHRREFRKDKKDITWVCSEYLKKGKSYCLSPNIRESELNYIFKDLIYKLPINLNEVINILINYYKNGETNNNYLKEIELLEKEINKFNIKKDKLLDLNINGFISNEEFCNRNNYFNDKINNLIKKMDYLKNNQDNSNNKPKELNSVIKEKINSQVTLSKIINLLLDYIIVSKINNDKNNIKLDIYLTFKTKKTTPILKESYEFLRGYDCTSTKRYKVKYYVNFFCN